MRDAPPVAETTKPTGLAGDGSLGFFAAIAARIPAAAGHHRWFRNLGWPAKMAAPNAPQPYQAVADLSKPGALLLQQKVMVPAHFVGPWSWSTRPIGGVGDGLGVRPLQDLRWSPELDELRAAANMSPLLSPITSYVIVLPDGSAREVTTSREHPKGIVRRVEPAGGGADRALQDRLQELQQAYLGGWDAPPGSSGRASYPHHAGLAEAYAVGNQDRHGFGIMRAAVKRREIVGVRDDGGPVFGRPVAVVSDALAMATATRSAR